MRLAFVRALINSAKINNKLHLLTGDLGFEVFEEFKEKFPNQFTNCGVSEANMIGVAAGMARNGFTCVCYSLVPFLAFRAFEQIRNDVCYPKLDIKIVGIGGGYSYSLQGQSHSSIEDISVMRSLPNMTVVCPGDPLETYLATIQMLKIKSPVYLRLGKKGEPNLMYEQIGNFKIGKEVIVKKGSGIAVFSTGNMLETTIGVTEELEKEGIFATHIHVHTVKPLDNNTISKIISAHDKIVTIEEHSIVGGFGSAIAEINVRNKNCLKEQLTIGVEDLYINIGGSQSFMRKTVGLDKIQIIHKIVNWIKNK